MKHLPSRKGKGGKGEEREERKKEREWEKKRKGRRRGRRGSREKGNGKEKVTMKKKEKDGIENEEKGKGR